MADHAEALEDFNRDVFSGRVFEARESRLRKALEMFESEQACGRVLDVAAGSGIASEALGHAGWTVSALDLSESLIQQVRARGIDDAQVHKIGSGPLPFSNDTFDGVFAGEIIEHLVDTRAFVLDITRVLKPGGVVVLTTPNLASLENRARLLLGIYPIWVEYELSSQGHVRAYTKRTLTRQLRSCGLTVESVKGNWVPFLPQAVVHDVRVPALARTGDWLPSLSQGLIVKARK